MARYAAAIFRLLSNDEELRREGIINLAAILNSPGSKWMLEEWRTDVCIRIYDSYNGILNHCWDPITSYCKEHPPADVKKRFEVTCVNCMADIELSVYQNRNDYNKILLIFSEF